jgi:ribosomal protein S18 acetylase RimI-like enzyme
MNSPLPYPAATRPFGKLGKAFFVTEYRSFRNTDPPGIVALWNDVFPGRGAVHMRTPSALEYFVFAKPYFDPDGLILAINGDIPVGFVHAGFGASADQSTLSSDIGVTCALAVRASERGKGLGTELLRRAEAYLAQRGARTFFAGSRSPHNPFYFGLLGGSDSPGFLASDKTAEPFVLRRGYELDGTSDILQRSLPSQTLIFPDARFASLRKKYEVCFGARTSTSTWWRECVLGPIDLMEFRVQDRITNEVMASVGVWEMQGFSQRWGVATLGIFDVEVQPSVRRKGLAKFLLAALLKQAQEQYFALVEVHVPADNAAALALFRGLGFEQADTGRSYRKTTIA